MISENASLLQAILTSAKRGVSARFVQINEKWGVKAYICEYDRDIAYTNQVKLNRLDIAPQAGIRFEIFNPDKEDFIFCYITEVADVFECIDYNDSRLNGEGFSATMSSLQRYFKQKCSENEIFCNDLHSGNVGFVGDKPVIIDTGMGYPTYVDELHPVNCGGEQINYHSDIFA